MMQVSRLKERYEAEIIDGLMRQFEYRNRMQVPKIDKIVLNMGVGDAKTDAKLLDGAVADMTLIAGQKPVITKARKSIAGFKIREKMPVGCMVTLRGERMYEFLDKLLNIALPRIRDFRGLSRKAFDGRGNYSMGVTEQLIFAEIDYDKVDRIRGMDIVIATTAGTDDECMALLEAFGMPFKKA